MKEMNEYEIDDDDDLLETLWVALIIDRNIQSTPLYCKSVQLCMHGWTTILLLQITSTPFSHA